MQQGKDLYARREANVKNETSTRTVSDIKLKMQANNNTSGKPHGLTEIKQYDDGQPQRCLLEVSATLLNGGLDSSRQVTSNRRMRKLLLFFKLMVSCDGSFKTVRHMRSPPAPCNSLTHPYESPITIYTLFYRIKGEILKKLGKVIQNCSSNQRHTCR
jgi:hypothetical protein